jgi:hypothetical protein
MSYPPRYAVLLDDAFVNVKLEPLLRRLPTARRPLQLDQTASRSCGPAIAADLFLSRSADHR